MFNNMPSGLLQAITLTRRKLTGTLVALLLLFAALWAFVEIAEEVTEGDTRDIDRMLLLALRTPGDPDDPLGPRWFEELARDITALGGFGVLTLLTTAVLGYLLLIRRFRMAAVLLAASAGGIALNTLLKLGFSRPRPDLVPHAAEVYTASFPSGHAMLSASIYLTLGALLAETQTRKRLKAYMLLIMVLLTLLVGASRVYLGVHWPSDVLAGWTLGAAWALLWWLVALRLRGG